MNYNFGQDRNFGVFNDGGRGRGGYRGRGGFEDRGRGRGGYRGRGGFEDRGGRGRGGLRGGYHDRGRGNWRHQDGGLHGIGDAAMPHAVALDMNPDGGFDPAEAENPAARRPMNIHRYTPKVAKLEELLQKDAHDLLMCVVNQRSELMGALHNCGGGDRDISPRHIPVMLKMLAKVVSCGHSNEILNQFLRTLLSTRFFTDRVQQIVNREMMEMIIKGKWTPEVGLECLKNLMTVMLACYDRMTNVAYERIHLVVMGLNTLITQLDSLEELNVDAELRELHQELLDSDKTAVSAMLSEAKREENDKVTPAMAEPPDNFRDYTVAPIQEELEKSNDRVFLRANRVQGKYESVDDYLDVQFRLMREDFMSPLRKGVNAHRNLNIQLRGKRYVSEVYVYQNAVVQYPVCLKSGIAHVVSFDASRYRNSWERNKRLLYGSLLCFFSEDYTRAFFATVADRDAVALRERGEITVKFMGENITEEQLNEKFILIESSAYFEAYRHVLKRLQAFTAATFPFKDHIVLCSGVVEAPEYLLRDYGYQFDFKCILSSEEKDVKEMLVNPLEMKKWPTKHQLGLDESQYLAIKSAVTRRIVLIQGPPGTGKTFIGLKIAKLLLENVVKRQDNFGPILVVCYTNHALDQFVEGIADFRGIKIVRVGGRSQSETLKRFKLVEIRQEYIRGRGFPADMRRNIGETKTIIEGLYDSLMNFSARLRATREHIINLNVLEQYIRNEHLADIVGDARTKKDMQQKMKEWLLGISTDEFMFEQETEEALLDLVEELTAETLNERINQVARRYLAIELGDEDDEEEDLDGGAHFEDDGTFEMNRRNLDDDDEKMEDAGKHMDQKIRALMGNDFINLDEDEHEVTNYQGGWQQVRLRGGALRRIVRHELEANEYMSQEEEEAIVMPLMLRTREKWRLYRLWRHRYRLFLRTKLTELMQRYDAACRQHQELRENSDRIVMQAHNVIAMTTTGAARYGDMLSILRPKIVIVEEAAEVFESHVVAALSEGCEHLILIGDHKQLRPSPTVYELAKRYSLDVSLFERLIKNKFHFNTLGLQHRMRPEISRLLRHEKLYPDLGDHESVLEHPVVKGIAQNLFFIDHRHKESHDDNIQSYSNTFEARYAVRLCRHFLMQGYEPEKITILTLYAGQLFELRKQMPKTGTAYRGMRITVVDNYQGEENDIIILSLVRSNEDKKIGFVGIDNRICVAISRARLGLYVLGNFQLFRQVSPLWDNILRIAEARDQVGPGLELVCQLHPPKSDAAAPSLVTSVEDFDKLAPEGGCSKMCKKRLKCGHVCVKTCHPSDREHNEYKCRKPCGKKCARDLHECKKLCFNPCGNCVVPVEVIRDDCGHQMIMSCFQSDSPDVPCDQPCGHRLRCNHLCQNKCGEAHTLRCTVIVTKISPFCGHEVRMPCCADAKDAQCRKPCTRKLDCGHKCVGTCWDCCEGRLHVACRAECNRPLVCGHQCSYPCGRECPPCRKKCQLQCVHARCDLKCGEQCIPCREMCTNRCRHRKCSKLCHEPCSVRPCNRPCNKQFACPKCKRIVFCPGLCGEECILLCRDCDAEKLTEIFFGSEDEPDARFLRLETCGHFFEVTGLDQWMKTDQEGAIGAKQCPRCKTTITATSCRRYMNEMKRTIADLEKVKRRMDADGDNLEERKRKLMLDIILLKIKNLTAMTENERFLSTFEAKANRANFMYEIIHCENIMNLLKKLDKYCKVALQRAIGSMQSVIEKVDEDFRIGAKHILDGLLRHFTRQVTNDTLEQCSMETQRFGDLIRIVHVMCLSVHRPDCLEASKNLWKDCCSDRSLTFDDRKHEEILQKIKELERKCGSMPGISDEERVQIVNAIGLSKGHWYKCPNGHVYAIGECGGAVELGKCPECKATIGGLGHSLATRNQLAPEMDGAAAPAWSEQMNLLLGNVQMFD